MRVGNLSWSATGTGSAALSGITAAAGANTILNADNAQAWSWALSTADKTGFTFGESSASTATGTPAILKASTLASSTAMPLYLYNLGDGLSFRVDDSAGDTTPFVVDASGNVGIGTTVPGTYKLNIAGTGYLGAAAWDYASDKRLKENIIYIQSGLYVIEQLKPVKFDYINGDKKQAGFITQEVWEVLPDIVTEGSDGMIGMKTESITPYLVKALQEQQVQIEALKQVVTQLDNVK